MASLFFLTGPRQMVDLGGSRSDRRQSIGGARKSVPKRPLTRSGYQSAQLLEPSTIKKHAHKQNAGHKKDRPGLWHRGWLFCKGERRC